MNINSNFYVLGFATIMCVIVGTLLSLLATALGPLQREAEKFDRQKNIMMAAGLCAADDERSKDELIAVFEARVRLNVVDTRSGEVLAEKGLEDLDGLNKEAAKADPKSGRPFRYVAVAMAEGGAVESYVLPISGPGLWGELFGFIALEADKDTVKGITFYKHKETPGLGGEVDNPAWKSKWPGKKVRTVGGELVSIEVKKGKVDPGNPRERTHAVDGLAGATITGKGVQKFLLKDLRTFAKYLGYE